ncbi:hypothetical protein ACFVEL_09790 [Bacillus thuringiensis]|uniref:hypothetical protein n=1 Tax=Bacillus thuringiensis TaxID=1428 RepID=UPI0036725804
MENLNQLSQEMNFNTFNPVILFQDTEVTAEHRRGDPYECFNYPGKSKVTISFMVPLSLRNHNNGKLFIELNHCITKADTLIDITLNGEIFISNYGGVPKENFDIQRFEIPFSSLALNNINTFDITLNSKSNGFYKLSDIYFNFETDIINKVTYHLNSNVSGVLYDEVEIEDNYSPGFSYLSFNHPSKSKCIIKFFIPEKYQKSEALSIILNHCVTGPDVSIDFILNGVKFVSNYKNAPQKDFDVLKIQIPYRFLNLYSTNTFEINLNSNSIGNYCLRDIILKIYGSQVPTDNIKMNDWMKKIPDNTPISNINIVGTHDSAAINPDNYTFYACQDFSISNQLEYGIRLLDVRIKVYKKSDYTYEFITCHGPHNFHSKINEYQSLVSLLIECRDFLTRNSSECVVMSLQIDDWNGIEKPLEKQDAINALHRLLIQDYPIYSEHDLNPNLGNVRGQIFVLNRVDDILRFGIPIFYQKNTSGEYILGNTVYVQDKYKELAGFGTAEKFDLVINALHHKNDTNLVLNFASGTTFGIKGVYIHDKFLNYLGQSSGQERLKNLGWILFDYPFSKYNTNTYGEIDVVRIINLSNFEYRGYELPFVIID